MSRKQIRLTKNIVRKDQGYISNSLDDLIKEVKGKKEDEGNLVRMNFEVSEELRNSFKAKVASQGKKVKDVFANFMIEYIKNDNETNIK